MSAVADRAALSIPLYSAGGVWAALCDDGQGDKANGFRATGPAEHQRGAFSLGKSAVLIQTLGEEMEMHCILFIKMLIVFLF